MNANIVVWMLINGLFASVLYFAYQRQSQLIDLRNANEITLVIVVMFLLLWLKNTFDTVEFLRFYRSTRNLDKRIVVESDPPSLTHTLTGHVGQLLDSLATKARRNLGARTTADNLLLVLENRLAVQRSIVAVGATLLITLGLIGTVAGLIQAMAGLEIVTSALGPKQAYHERHLRVGAGRWARARTSPPAVGDGCVALGCSLVLLNPRTG